MRLCHLNEIEEGCARGFDPWQQGRDSIFVVRQEEQLRAYYNACPHQGYKGSPMAWRKDAYLNAGHTRIVCAAHGAEFDIDTGVCVQGPCVGQSLQKAEIDIDDQQFIYVLTEPRS